MHAAISFHLSGVPYVCLSYVIGEIPRMSSAFSSQDTIQNTLQALLRLHSLLRLCSSPARLDPEQHVWESVSTDA